MTARADSQKGTWIAVAVIIAGGGVAGILLGRGEATPSLPAAKVAAAASSPPPTDSPRRTSAVAAATDVMAPLGEEELARFARESVSGPAASRVAAIDALSRASRDQALPLLKRALLNGDPAVDRPAALQALRALALAQGDADQRIRDAMREVIYHGDDERFAADAQETLGTIEESESGR